MCLICLLLTSIVVVLNLEDLFAPADPQAVLQLRPGRYHESYG